jgi:hypothetical protein
LIHGGRAEVPNGFVGLADRRQRQSWNITRAGQPIVERLLVIAFHPIGIDHTGRHVCIEPPRSFVGGNRFIEQSAVSTCIDETGE